MESIVGMFKRREDADLAVNALKAAGLDEAVNVITRESAIRNALETPGNEAQSAQAALADTGSPKPGEREDQRDLANADTSEAAAVLDAGHVSDTAGKAAAGGGIVGGITGLLVGVGAIAIPGVGPILAVGSLAATLAAAAAGAGVGAVSGGLLGMLAGFDIAAEHAEVYAEGLKRGRVMVVVHAPEERGDEVRVLLNQAHAATVTDMEHEFRSDGWSRAESAGPDASPPAMHVPGQPAAHE